MSNKTRKRRCFKEKENNTDFKGSRQICIPIAVEYYFQMIYDAKSFRQYLDKMLESYPELFPCEVKNGYTFHDILPASKKLEGVRLRRIKIKSVNEDFAQDKVFTIRPSFVMPYMTAFVSEVEKPLFLRRFGVPFWALTYVFGHDDMYWYRLEQRIGQNSLVGTTVKDKKDLPQDLIADEKHSRFNGEKAYIATTVANDCVLGASIALKADENHLTDSYQYFKSEGQNVDPDYEPKTVNTDGWKATELAWRNLFHTISTILCFLHAFIKIRNCCKHLKEHYDEIRLRVWNIYDAQNPKAFISKVKNFKKWAKQNIENPKAIEAILKLCQKTTLFVKTYHHPSAYRTSNMLDRAMDRMDRYLFMGKYFHGHLLSAEYRIRAWALYLNFSPYCPRAKIAKAYMSPVHKLNEKVYHPNWLQNMMSSASMGGYRR